MTTAATATTLAMVLVPRISLRLAPGLPTRERRFVSTGSWCHNCEPTRSNVEPARILRKPITEISRLRPSDDEAAAQRRLAPGGVLRLARHRSGAPGARVGRPGAGRRARVRALVLGAV